ncbi:MAG: 50S ribosomal protein L18 [Candidatus Eremiobacteraeota bacterium]|nr:50S ribosomal protein L18 [Candidatus Eremiobacteraeota bacterium]MBV8222122.1 50S ribosomal protein L18 [Candidatus Eremiobacteraeota bacterium]MBV8282330.1 50S ribosomal protein L18 [Candidatus Eremiobacteraeota bacterium]
MATLRSRNALRLRRHGRIRKGMSGSTQRPRLSVFRSLHHIYAQLIDDTTGRTLAAASTREKAVADGLSSHSGLAAAERVGSIIAQRAKDKGVSAVVFDRGGYKYHGRIKALADAARGAGLEF